MVAGLRQEKIADQICRELSKTLRRDSNDPRFKCVRVTAVTISADYQFAKVYVSLVQVQEKDSTMLALNKAHKFFRGVLASTLNLRTTPKVRFVYDESLERGERLAALIDEAVSQDSVAQLSEL